MSVQNVSGYVRGLLPRLDSFCTRPVLSLCTPSTSGSIFSRQSACASASGPAIPQIYRSWTAAQLQSTGRYMNMQTFMSASQRCTEQGRPRITRSFSESTWMRSSLGQLRGISTAHRHASTTCRANLSQRWQSRLKIQPCSTVLSFQRSMATQRRGAALSQKGRLQKKASEQGLYLVAMVVGMVGLTYASVPLYRYLPAAFLLRSVLDQK